jgi:tellurium resistance protein TerD
VGDLTWFAMTGKDLTSRRNSMALQLNLGKDTDSAKKLSLNLAKPAKFSIELFWDSPHDLDAHALLGTNSGQGAKITALDQVLSTYNCVKTNKQGILPANPNGSFNTPCGSLHHSGDARTGVGTDIDEVITIDGSMIPNGVNEIPIFVTIHPSKAAKFAEVKTAGIRIKNDQGTVLGDYVLSNQFGAFDAVQMGSLILGDNGWEYAEVGIGINGDFNTILGYFS